MGVEDTVCRTMAIWILLKSVEHSASEESMQAYLVFINSMFKNPRFTMKHAWSKLRGHEPASRSEVQPTTVPHLHRSLHRNQLFVHMPHTNIMQANTVKHEHNHTMWPLDVNYWKITDPRLSHPVCNTDKWLCAIINLRHICNLYKQIEKNSLKLSTNAYYRSIMESSPQ